MSDIIDALAGGQVTATALAKAYLARIAAYDRAGPALNSVRALNPDALAIAGKLDGTRPSAKRPLAGVPILLKDNIATSDKQPTTAGSLALEGARARRDATVVKLLRKAGAVILGKANLTEFANILAIEMPGGYSSLGGQVKNPYAPALMGDHDIPLVSPGGIEFGFGGRRGGRPVRGVDRHRDVGLAAVPRKHERACHRQADGWPDQPRRHHSDRTQPGHRGADDAHRARRGHSAECAGGPGPARSRDKAAAAAGRLHRGPLARCDEGRAYRRAERPLRSAERSLLRQAATRMGQGDDRGDQGARGSRRRHRARQHSDAWLARWARHRHGRAQPQSAEREQGQSDGVADRVPLRAEIRSQSLFEGLGDQYRHQDHGRYHRLQRGARGERRCASARTSFSPPTSPKAI